MESSRTESQNNFISTQERKTMDNLYEDSHDNNYYYYDLTKTNLSKKKITKHWKPKELQFGVFWTQIKCNSMSFLWIFIHVLQPKKVLFCFCFLFVFLGGVSIEALYPTNLWGSSRIFESLQWHQEQLKKNAATCFLGKEDREGENTHLKRYLWPATNNTSCTK